MSTISFTVPAQPFLLNAQSVNTALPVTDGTDDTKSFADCLKETNDDSDQEDQTAVTPQSNSSPKKTTEDKGSHHKTHSATSDSLAIADVGQPQALDPRSMMLSWKKAAGGQGKSHIQGAASAAATQTTEKASASTSPKAPIAFAVSIPKDGATANPSVKAPVNADKPDSNLAVAATKDGQTDADSGNASSGGHAGGGSNSGEASSAAPGQANSATDMKDVMPAAAFSTNVVNSTASAGIMQSSVPAAYSAVDGAKAATTVQASSATAAVDEPPTMPTVKPRSIEIQVPGTGDNKVDVRISERAGNVDVTVRTPDEELAQSLRQHLPELSESLSQSGVNGQILQPGAAAETSSGNNNNTSHDETSQEWQQQAQQQMQQQADSQQQQQNGGSTAWMNEFYTE